jgi:hypothetical protein
MCLAGILLNMEPGRDVAQTAALFEHGQLDFLRV